MRQSVDEEDKIHQSSEVIPTKAASSGEKMKAGPIEVTIEHWQRVLGIDSSEIQETIGSDHKILARKEPLRRSTDSALSLVGWHAESNNPVTPSPSGWEVLTTEPAEETARECDLLQCDDNEWTSTSSDDDDEGYTPVLSLAWGNEGRPQAPELSVEVPEGAEHRMHRRDGLFTVYPACLVLPMTFSRTRVKDALERGGTTHASRREGS